MSLTNAQKKKVVTLGGLSTYNSTLKSQMVGKTVNLTYAQLKALRDGSQLIPGQWYRITDYVTTTAQENTQSAGHAFDILVMAEDTNMLSENALAALHDGDTYFANSGINAWELKYCLDNDTNRFSWATTNGGKGVIYRMIDERGNDVPYDFKNILYQGEKTFTVKYVTYATDEYVYKRNTNNDKMVNGVEYYGWSVSTKISNGASMLPTDYYVTTEDISTSMTRYTYNNGSRQMSTNNNGTVTINQPLLYYTFDYGQTDYSFSALVRQNKIYSNGIANIRFVSDRNTSYIQGNYFSNGCYDITIGNDCNYNHFENDCYEITLSEYCRYNKFGRFCSNIDAKGTDDNHSLEKNVFGKKCREFSLAGYIYNNSFGDNCSNFVINGIVYWNTFKYGCEGCKFLLAANAASGYFYKNLFLPGSTAVFRAGYGSHIFNNVIGVNSNVAFDATSINNNISGIKIGNECDSITINGGSNHITIGDGCSRINFKKSYTRFVIIENGNQDINITSTQTTSPSSMLRNFTVAQGVNNSTTVKTISHNTVNDTFKTTYQPQNSQIVSV